jgi:hypothetical protein
MRRFFAAIIGVAVALVPIAGETCGLSCDFDRPAPVMATPEGGSCPLHAGAGAAAGGARRPVPLAPSRCGHDHSTARVALLRTSGAAPAHNVSVDALPLQRPLVLSTIVFRHVDPQLTPPPLTSRFDILRI